MQYSDKVIEHFSNPHNVGEIENASGVGTVGNAKCGDIMRIYLDIDEDTKIIKDCKFKTFGCGAAIATSSMATDMVIGKTIYEAMEVTSLLAEESIHAALWDYCKKHNVDIPGLKEPKKDVHDGEEEIEDEE